MYSYPHKLYVFRKLFSLARLVSQIVCLNIEPLNIIKLQSWRCSKNATYFAQGRRGGTTAPCYRFVERFRQAVLSSNWHYNAATVLPSWRNSRAVKWRLSVPNLGPKLGILEIPWGCRGCRRQNDRLCVRDRYVPSCKFHVDEYHRRRDIRNRTDKYMRERWKRE